MAKFVCLTLNGSGQLPLYVNPDLVAAIDVVSSTCTEITMSDGTKKYVDGNLDKVREDLENPAA